ncbi:MAG TPA: hypothetical protein VGK48_24455 [Terriglobia bacterium]
MKKVVVLLTLSLVVHLQCGGSCLAGSAAATAAVNETTSEPPCHQHAESPSKHREDPSHAPAHANNSPCSQGQGIEAKLSGARKLILPLAAIMPAAAANLTPHRPVIVRFGFGTPPRLEDPPTLFPVLRI